MSDWNKTIQSDAFKALSEHPMTTTDPKLIERIARVVHEARSIIPWEVTAQQDIAYRDARAVAPIVAAAINEAAHLWEDALELALTPEISDVEAETALTSEGIYVWGPDGERFERMFAVVAKCRRTAIEAHKESQHG